MEYLKCCDNSDDKYLLELPLFNLLREAIVDRDNSKVCQIFSEIITASKWFLDKFIEFVNTTSHENETFLYLNRYCEMVEILFDSIKADREGNFQLYLTSTRQMLPYFFLV